MLQQIADGEIDRDQALELCEENGSPVAQVFAGAVRKWGRPSVEVEQAVIDAGERVAEPACAATSASSTAWPPSARCWD